MNDSPITTKFACPRCDAPIHATKSGYECGGCDTQFPRLEDTPFLFAEPGVALDEWRQRYHSRQREIEHALVGLSASLAQSEADSPANARIQREHDALTAHQAELGALLAPLDVTSMAADHSSYLAMRTRLPDDQGLVTYYANLHRDWCWGDEENRLSCEQVAGALQETPVGEMLVLGAGGGRLAYDLHQMLDNPLTVALDFNPLLMLAGSALAGGKTLALHEFPIAPRRAEDVAVARQLEAPGKAREGLHWVLANVLRAPFKPASFDTLVTPWLCDVLDEPLHVQAQRWNRLLRKGGRWVWFGSHVFRSKRVEEQHSLEETMAIIEAAGFGDLTLEESDIPYMVSPANRHARQERIITLTMTKQADTETPARHVALPDWLVRGDLPVPTNQSFQSQGMASRIHAFFFSMIDGERSLEDMATLMEQENLMSKAEGIAALRNFMIRVLAESEGYSTF
ncbi:MAG: class I SAM-dependent methyltransferase [Woeseiaceae bacterium]